MGLNRILCTVPLPGQCIIPRLDQYIVLHQYILPHPGQSIPRPLGQYIALHLDHYIYFLTT